MFINNSPKFLLKSFSTEANDTFMGIVPAKTYHDPDKQKKDILLDVKNKTGVYMWKHKVNGKYYVGSAKDLRNRLLHYYNINHLTKRNSMLINRAILKDGAGAFNLHILEYCSPENLIQREQYYIDTLNPMYNILRVAASSKGYKHTDETLYKIKGDQNHFHGKTHTEENRTKMKEIKTGTLLSLDTKAKISKAMIGKVFSAEHKVNLSASKVNSIKLSVFNIATGVETNYLSVGEAERSLSLPKDAIRANLRSKTQKPYRGIYIFKQI